MKKLRNGVSAIPLVLTLALVSGCGKKTAPRAPEYFAPDKVEYFQARGTVSGVRLTWQAPVQTADGDKLEDLEKFAILKREYRKDDLDSFKVLTYILARKPSSTAPVEESSSAKPSKQLGALGGAFNKTETASSPDQLQYSFEDSEVKPGKQYEYAVAAQNIDGVRGDNSPIMRIRYVGEASIVEQH